MSEERRHNDDVIIERLDNMSLRMEEQNDRLLDAIKDHEKRIRSLEVLKYAMHGAWALLLALYAYFDQIGHGKH